MGRLLLLLLLLAACGDNPADRSAEVEGTYLLVVVDGRRLPATGAASPGGNDSPEIIAGTMELHGGGTFRETATYRQTSAQMGVQTWHTSDTGNYAVQGAQVEFRSDQGFIYTGTLRKGQLEVTTGGGTATWNKQ
jgi:hypothetical protein